MNDERYERFEREVAELRVGQGASRELWWGRIGGLLMLAGPAVGVVAYLGSIGTTDPAVQRDMIIVGLLAVTIAIVGVGLFVRSAAVRYFRYWAARLSYEIARADTVPSPTTPGVDGDAVRSPGSVLRP